MSDTGLTVPGMTEPPRRYDVTVTVTVDQDSDHHPNPAEFAVAADPWRLKLDRPHSADLPRLSR
jgi:hypothetical protein